ncbi:hypothetical protein FLJC2902T_21430 [Flavobacterium limnosediminis JC2902]|uniref:Uncharacterized protein n=1 Tax=Flavobacterium limnosediminis JC2902 TaxID=1341181 RepID=V6SKR3_9FLAO|nr:hypothetical protein FLJC2902T_21430 [Flavobacterium limnosediminis JC2902]
MVVFKNLFCKPFFAGFEENFNKIALRNPFYFNLKKVVLQR